MFLLALLLVLSVYGAMGITTAIKYASLTVLLSINCMGSLVMDCSVSYYGIVIIYFVE